MPVYCDHLRNIIKAGINRKDGYENPLRDFHICVDAGNGGGGFFATQVLAPLGADISGAGIYHIMLCTAKIITWALISQVPGWGLSHGNAWKGSPWHVFNFHEK